MYIMYLNKDGFNVCFRHAAIRAVLRGESIRSGLLDATNFQCLDCAHDRAQEDELQNRRDEAALNRERVERGTWGD